jgi:restriction system protein
MSFPTLLLFSAAYAGESGTVSDPSSAYDLVASLAFLVIVAALLTLPLGLIKPRLVPGSQGKRRRAALISLATVGLGVAVFVTVIRFAMPEHAAQATDGWVGEAGNDPHPFSAYNGLAIVAALVTLAALLSLPLGLIKPRLVPGSDGKRWKAALNSLLAAYFSFAVFVIALALATPDQVSGQVIGAVCTVSVGIALLYGWIRFLASLPALELVRRLSLQHQDMLAAKWMQSVRIDEYGQMQYDQLYAELAYFIGSVIRPQLNRFQREHYLNQVPRKAWTIIIEVAMQRVRELYPASPDAGEAAEGRTGDRMGYEAYIAERLRHLGWSAVTAVGGARAVIAEKRGVRVAIHPLLQDSPIDAPAIRAALAGKDTAQADWAAVVTNAGFTTAAEHAAASIGVVPLLDSQLADLERLCQATQGRRLA